jgi:flagellar hook-basal body complex protein FliE
MNINAFVNNTQISNDLQKNAGVTDDNTTGTENNGVNFLDTLNQKLNDVNDQQIAADDITQKFIKGDETDVHKVMVSTEEAKLSLELAVQIRNKLVDAYQEFNRMQI